MKATLKSHSHWLLVGIALLWALVLVFAYWKAFSELPINQRPDAWGQFGDYIGGLLNPVVSGLTLMVAIIVWRLQETELKATKSAFVKQTTLQTFFNLLQQHREMVNAVELEVNPHLLSTGGPFQSKYVGRSAFAIVVSILGQQDRGDLVEEDAKDQAKKYHVTYAGLESIKSQLLFANWYIGKNCELPGFQRSPFPSALEMSFGHIFRSTFQLLKFSAHAPELNASEKQNLVNYLRAQMSEDEFVMYALSSLTNIGEKSRSVSIIFNFFEDRMQTIDWARKMTDLLSDSDENLIIATSQGFLPLEN